METAGATGSPEPQRKLLMAPGAGPTESPCGPRLGGALAVPAIYETSATFQDLQQFLSEPGCALCHQEAQSERRYFDTLLYENVTAPATEARLRASDGYCRRHLETLLGLRDPLATAILYRGLLLEKQRALARWQRGGRRRQVPRQERGTTAPCPACEAEQEGVRRAAEVLAAGLDGGALREAWAASDGLCWPHFLEVRGRCRAGRESLDGVESQRIAALLADVEALIDSFDYRNDSVRSQRVESAWRRVAATVGGRIRGGQTPDARTERPEPQG